MREAFRVSAVHGHAFFTAPDLLGDSNDE